MIIKKAAIAAIATFALSSSANAVVFDLGFNLISSWDAAGDSDNAIITVDLAAALGFAPGAPVAITAIGWDVTIDPQGASWYSEATVLFTDSAGGGPGVNLAPGSAEDFANDGAPHAHAYSSGGLVSLAGAGIPDILLLDDGVLRLEFYEGFDDVDGAVDAFWSGTLSVDAQVVPIPAALPLLLSALGLTGFLARRRG